MLDEYTRECLALVVDRSLTSRHVIDVLRRLIAKRGAPRFVRSDNGPEFIAHRVGAYLLAAGSGARHIDPGAPWQNGYTESFNGKLRDELLPPRRGGRARSSSGAWPRRSCCWNRGVVTTTRTVRTARSATFPRPRLRPVSHPQNRRRHCHSRWYREGGPVSLTSQLMMEASSLVCFGRSHPDSTLSVPGLVLEHMLTRPSVMLRAS